MSSFATRVLALLDQKAVAFGPRTALSVREKDVLYELTYEELAHRSRLVSARLIERGLAVGERVALLSESRPEWGIAFFSGVLAGGVVVPLDAKLSEMEIRGILADSAPVVLLASSTYWDLACSLRATTPSLRDVIRIDDFLGATEAAAPDSLPASRGREPEDLAVLIYTSGTTGPPKGVMITFGNLVFQASRLEAVMQTRASDCFLSVLPLHHLLELTGGFLAALHSGAEVCYARSLYPQDLIPLMKARRVSVILGVPLLFKTLKESIEREIRRRASPVRIGWSFAMIFAWFLPVRAWRRALFFTVHRRWGGKLRLLVSGGAPLDEKTAQFFDRLGVPLLQGYGLTETSPVISVNTLRANRIGSVGRPLEGVEIRILAETDAKDGEILTRGPHVMRGYYRREDSTRQVIDQEGWFHTGDLGFIDRDGFLHITGRKKNIIALGSGKKVQPEEVEAVLAAGKTVQDVCVLGRIAEHGIAQGTEEIWAVVVPSDAVREEYRERPGVLEDVVREELAVLALKLAPFKRPVSIVCFPDELPKTGTRKTRRFLVEAWLDAREVRS